MSRDLPFGALLVDEIVGRPPRLPDELLAIAASLARLHAVPLPPPNERSPLGDAADPIAATFAAIQRQAGDLSASGLSRAARTALEEEIAWARDFAASGKGTRTPRSLVATDAHPGNFLIRPDGAAIFVDLEKSAYGAPAIDIAHASLRPSTSWDPDCGAVLGAADILTFYRSYLDHRGPESAAALCPWLLPLRRLTWLRTITFYLRFRRQQEATRLAGSVEPAVLEHIKTCIADNLDADTIESVRAEWIGANRLPLDSLCS